MLQVPGVGPLTALCFVLTLEDPQRFKRYRNIGAYLGLTPRQHESGASSPELRITTAGDRTLRRLLVSCAQYILGPFGPDTDLRRWGLALAERGGKNAKKRAVVATARKLATLPSSFGNRRRSTNASVGRPTRATLRLPDPSMPTIQETLETTARSGRLRCNALTRHGDVDNQIAAPDRTDLNLHRFPKRVTQSAHGSLADDRPFLPRGRHVGLDRNKLLMEVHGHTHAELAMGKYGCVDFISAREGEVETAISYWHDLEQIRAWKQDVEHVAAQQLGRMRWYRSYRVEVVEIVREYAEEA